MEADLVEHSLQRVDELIAGLDHASFDVVRTVCARGRAKFDAFEARCLAAAAGDDEPRARRMAGAGQRRSKRAARAAASRAAAVAKNPVLADAVADGALAPEQLDIIADAMKTDQSAATDPDLIQAVSGATVDQGRKIACDWAAAKANADDATTEHERQRRARRMFRYTNRRSGLSAMTLEGDHTTIEELWNTIVGRERGLYDNDGGRDLSFDKHPRTRDQRMFDAAADLIRGLGTSSGRGRPSIVFVVPVDGTAVARSAGGSAVSDRVLQDALKRADLSVELVDSVTAVPLAWGRIKRRATLDQYKALVVRDGGCVLCGTHWLHCEVHHLTPWNSPAAGKTDLGQLALLCATDHHELHDTHRTLVHQPDGTWTIRRARTEEIAPAGLHRSRSTRRRHAHRSATRTPVAPIARHRSREAAANVENPTLRLQPNPKSPNRRDPVENSPSTATDEVQQRIDVA